MRLSSLAYSDDVRQFESSVLCTPAANGALRGEDRRRQGATDAAIGVWGTGDRDRFVRWEQLARTPVHPARCGVGRWTGDPGGAQHLKGLALHLIRTNDGS